MKLFQNLVINGLNTALNLCFPLLTLPLVTRALGPDTLGCVNLVTALIATIGGLANVGVSTFAIISVAGLRNREEHSNHFYNLVLLEFFGSALGWIAYEILVLFYGGWQHNIAIFQIGGACIFLGFLSSEWFFIGRMNFLFMTVRNLMVKLLTLGLIVFLVHTPQDGIIYMLTLAVGTVGGQLINFVFAASQLSFKGVKLHPIRYVRNLYVYAPLQIANYLQLGFDKICLGYMVTASALAYYTLSDRLCTVFISLVNGVTGVMLPYLTKSALAGQSGGGQRSELIQKNVLALSLFLPIAMLLIIGIDRAGYDWSVVLFGAEFHDVGTVLMIMKWNLIVYTLINLLANMYFLPSGRQRVYLRSLLAGVALQFVCIPAGMHFGNILWACGGLAVSNLLVLVGMFFSARSDVLQMLRAFVTSRDNLRRFIAGMVIYGVTEFVPAPASAQFSPVLLYSLGIVFGYFVLLLIFGDSQLAGYMRQRFRRQSS